MRGLSTRKVYLEEEAKYPNDFSRIVCCALINFQKCRAKYHANVRFNDSFKNHSISPFIYVIVADDRMSNVDGIEYLRDVAKQRSMRARFAPTSGSARIG